MAEDLTIQRLRSLMETQGLGGRTPEIQSTKVGADAAKSGTQESAQTPSFADTLKQSIAEVNALKMQADNAIQDLAVGKTDDVQGTILAVEKADVSFKLMMEIRNKLVSAYQEVMRLQV
jgi:flagellar hook-basal body complex protein FliE